ncbi:DUF5047 domain-containing protein [Streptomyces canus]|uniref:DUF5047 domain-containing protein n=1 Tax=Streptomyces canus TaxID=58343 RepID=UPI003CFA1C61
MSDVALAAVQRSHTMRVRVEAWRDGELLTDDVPVDGGSESRDASVNVPESVSLTVPRRDRGTDWDPIDPDHPLAAYGQQLHISYGVDVGNGFEWIDRGWFLVTESSADGDTVTVQAGGLLTLIDEAKFAAPYQPSGTFISTVRSLVEPALTVAFDSSLVDRSIPVGMQWDSDRLGALNEVLDTWPATARVTEDGLLLVEPVTDGGTPVIDITDGTGGTVVRWQGSTTRDAAANCVIAQGEDSSGNQIQGVAYDTQPASPFRFGGPFNPLPVPFTFSSPLLTTVAQCRAAAATRLRNLRRANSRKLVATVVPHPGLLTGDVAAVTGAGLRAEPCAIEGLNLPYSPGSMSLKLRVLSGG